ncbi:MAG TPA: GNAT family acetyltransferase [Anaerolineales bacterium]
MNRSGLPDEPGPLAGPVSIREFAYPRDYSAVIDLWNNAGPGIHTGRSDTQEEIRKKLERDADLFLVAEIDGQLIGTVLGGFDGRRGMIYHLAVAPGNRQSGIGSALLAELEGRLQAKGCLKSYMLVVSDNELARHFYEARGWEPMEILIYGKNLI